MLAIAQPSLERDHRPGDQRQDEGQHRREEEQQPVRAGRDDRLLDQHLERVGERLQQAERTDHVRALAQLDRRQHLALGIGQVGDARSAAAPGSPAPRAGSGSRWPSEVVAEEAHRACPTPPPARAAAQRRGALRHGRARAADRVGHVVIRHRRHERRGAIAAPSPAGPVVSEHAEPRQDVDAREHRVHRSSRARSASDRVVRQRLAEALAEGAQDPPILARLARRIDGAAGRAARGLRCSRRCRASRCRPRPAGSRRRARRRDRRDGPDR